MEKQKISYLHIEKQLNEIADRVCKSDTIRMVTGVPRGGLIPAVIFSHRYQLPFILPDEAKNLPRNQRKTILVIDDIADSGNTLHYYETLGFQTAALYYKKSSKHIPTYFGEIGEEDIWVVFPWEREAAPAVPDYVLNKSL